MKLDSFFYRTAKPRFLLPIPKRIEGKIDFWAVSGKVLKSEKRSETYVHGYTQTYLGAVRGNVDSDVIRHHEFWLKTSDGREESFKLVGYDIPMREGQEVTVLLAKRSGDSSSYIVALINHSAERYWWFDRSRDLVWQHHAYKASWLGLLFGMAVMALLAGFILQIILQIPLLVVAWILIPLVHWFGLYNYNQGGEIPLSIIYFGSAGIVFIATFIRFRRFVRDMLEIKANLDKHVQNLASKILEAGPPEAFQK